MSIEYEDYCEVWPENPQILEDEARELSQASAMFSLVFHLSFVHLPQDLTEEDEDELSVINELMETDIDIQIFDVEYNRLINNDTSRQTLEEILSSMHVSSEPFFVEKILRCARDMTNDKVYENYKVLRMHVRLSVVVYGDGEEEELSSYTEDEEEEQLSSYTEDEEEEQLSSYTEDEEDEAESRMVGASKSEIEKLEMVEIEDQSSKEACAICLEEFWLGLQVIRMPCSHVFHSNCIVNWLNRSKFCPLCRFEIN